MDHPNPNITESQIASYARLGATDREVADALGCSEEYLHERHLEFLARTRAEFRLRIRARQLQLAMDGDRAMLTLLVKRLPDSDDPSAGAKSPSMHDPSGFKDETDDQVFEHS